MLTFQSIEIMFLLSGEINLISRPWPQRWELQGPLSVAEAPQHWKQLVTSFFGLTKSSPQTLLLPSVVREFKSAHVYEGNIGSCVNYLWYLSFVICIIKVRFNKFWKRDWISMIFWNQIMIKKNWSKMVCEVFWQG